MSQPASTIRKPLIGFSLFAVLALFLTYVIWSTLERTVDGKTAEYTTKFQDASGLAVGDDVRMAGVRVGRVHSIDLDEGQAKVGFDVVTNQPIYDNTRAAIRYQNLIGQRYLALDLDGDAPGKTLGKGSALKKLGVDSFDVTRLLAGFQPVFDTLTPEQVNELSKSLIQTFQGDEISLSRTLEQIGQVAGDMADRDQVLGAIINNLAVVMRELAGQGDQMKVLLTSTSNLIEGLNGNSSAIGDSIDRIGQTADGFAEVIKRSQGTLVSASNNAVSSTNQLIASGAKLDKGAAILPKFLVRLPRVLSQGNYLNIYQCDLDLSFGNVFLPPGLLGKISGKNHSTVCR